MKRSFLGVLLLALVLIGNIICTQYTVNMYFAQRYEASLLFAVGNLLLFPIAVVLYRSERSRG